MPDLSSNNRETLLGLARQAIEDHLAAGGYLHYETSDPALNLKRGCFVTLKKMKQLRGCIGTFDANEILYKNIIRMAVAAGFQDPRFSPLTKPELAFIKIEISVLGPLEKVESLDEIEIGKHGILVKYADKSGTFLPEVAVEQGWSVPEFVTFCAREKARLGPKEIALAEIFRYEVEKFQE